VAAVEPSTAAQPEQPYDAALEAAAGLTDPSDIEQQHTVAELDEAQENLLKWMLFLDGDQQEADLDEAVDLEEVGDGEFEALYDEVEGMLDESEASFKVGDKVYGTVYEVDEDGAYVEIGAKTAGFVPLAECSLGKLKTVRFWLVWFAALLACRCCCCFFSSFQRTATAIWISCSIDRSRAHNFFFVARSASAAAAARAHAAASCVCGCSRGNTTTTQTCTFPPSLSLTLTQPNTKYQQPNQTTKNSRSRCCAPA
jgi:hypothetical protein